MALIFTPGQLRQRAEFYYQLAQLTVAGFGLIQALEQLQRSPPSRSYRQPIGVVLGELAEGATFTEALRCAGGWLPPFDVALLDAGEKSGRLDACFRLLADYYHDRARMARQLLGDLAYPLFVMHFAVFILPFPDFFRTGDWLAYLLTTVGVLLPCYVVVAAVVYAAQSRHGERWRTLVELFLHPVPVLGTARRFLALGRLAAALEALLSAGVTVLEAWELAAIASGSPALGRTVLGWRPLLRGGHTPAEVLSTSGAFPEVFVQQYATGEVSGKLDDALKRLHQYYTEEGTRKLRILAQWTPRMFYLLVAVMIAYRIITFWSGYFQQIRNAGGF